jgi:hypothetical protein
MDRKIKEPEQNIMQLVASNWISRLVYTAVYLQIPDILSAGEISIDVIAGKCGAKPDYLYRVMKALAGAGFFIEKRDKHFANTPLSQMISSRTMGPIVRMLLSPWHNAAWDMLPRAVETGKEGFTFAMGKDAFTWLKENHEEGDIYQRANGLKASLLSEKLAETCNFREGETLIDIGGGYGNLLTGLLSSHTTLKGIIADLPHVAAEAHTLIESRGLSERCRAVDCDFFHEVPGGGDTYILCNILHDWDDEKAGIILTNCSKAMKSGSKLLVLEMLLPAESRPSFSQLMDIEVMIMGNGRERNKEEFRKLFEKTGFSLQTTIPLDGETFLLESTAV